MRIMRYAHAAQLVGLLLPGLGGQPLAVLTNQGMVEPEEADILQIRIMSVKPLQQIGHRQVFRQSASQFSFIYKVSERLFKGLHIFRERGVRGFKVHGIRHDGQYFFIDSDLSFCVPSPYG